MMNHILINFTIYLEISIFRNRFFHLIDLFYFYWTIVNVFSHLKLIEVTKRNQNIKAILNGTNDDLLFVFGSDLVNFNMANLSKC